LKRSLPEYCTRAHSASSKRAGVTLEQIAALPFYKRSLLFDENEKATIRYAGRVTRAATTIRAAELEELRKFYDVRTDRRTDACDLHGEFSPPASTTPSKTSPTSACNGSASGTRVPLRM
jgi:hypothetical protein